MDGSIPTLLRVEADTAFPIQKHQPFELLKTTRREGRLD
jgi:hypothetical protein